MAASNFLVYQGWKQVMGTAGGGDMSSATYRMRLATAGYTPNLQTDLSASAGFAFLSATAGQTSAASARSLASIEWTSAASGIYMWNFADPIFTASVATSARYAVVYHDATNRLVGYYALETSSATQDVVFTQLTVQVHANGAFRLSGGTTA